MIENIYKPTILFNGAETDYTVRWHKMTVIPEINESGLIHFIIMTDKERINIWENDVTKVGNYAKKKVTTKGRGKYANGQVKILVRENGTTNEQIVGIVEKDITRHYKVIENYEKPRKL